MVWLDSRLCLRCRMNEGDKLGIVPPVTPCGNDLTAGLASIALRGVSYEKWAEGKPVRYLFLDCGPVVDCIVLDEVSWISYASGLWFVKPAVAAFPTGGI